MGLAFDQAYFEGGGGGFGGYDDWPHFGARAAWLVQRFGADAALAEVGAGFGYLVRRLRACGMARAIGYDCSAYAVAADLDCAATVIQADAGSVDLAGHDPVVSWNLLECLKDDADAARVVATLEAYGAKQVHVVCTDDDVDAASYTKEGYLIRPVTFWQSLFLTEGAILVEYRSRDVWQLRSGVWSTVAGLGIPLSGDRVTD